LEETFLSLREDETTEALKVGNKNQETKSKIANFLERTEVPKIGVTCVLVLVRRVFDD
jgi:hypothetical protein